MCRHQCQQIDAFLAYKHELERLAEFTICVHMPLLKSTHCIPKQMFAAQT